MMIKMGRQQQAEARRQLLGDAVWVVCNDTLRQLQRDGATLLSPVEVFLSAREFCNVTFALQDVEEGLPYEIDDLVEEMGEDDALLVMMVATLMMQAMSKRRIGIGKMILLIYERLNDHERFMPLLEKLAHKEEQRWIEGKRTDLLNYELKEIELDGGGMQEKTMVVSEITDAALNLSNEEVRGVLVSLVSVNNKYDHKFDEQIDRLLEKLGITQSEIHNHFEKDSHCQVFNDKVTGQFT